jgi:formate hydrogenlyase transcriptional activator
MSTPPPQEDVLHVELVERLRFETTLADLSARFVNVPTEEVDREISEAQRLLCECLGMDGSSVWQRSADEPATMRRTHIYRAGADSPPSDELGGQDRFPWVARQVLSGKAVVVPNTANTPPEAARDRETWAHFGVKSALALPLSTGGGPVFGVLSFDTLHREFDWPEAIVTRCQMVAQVFANAIARKRSDRALRESEERYRTLFESAPAGIVWIGIDGCVKAANSVQARLYGYDCAHQLKGLYTPLFVAERDREKATRNLRDQLEGREVPPRCYSLVRRDGSEFIGEVTAGLLRGPQQEVQGYLCVTRDITALVSAQNELRQSLQEVNRLQEQLQNENVYLRQEIQSLHGQLPIVGNSQALRQVIAQAQQVAPTDSTVLILGETGTGKELLASHIHRTSRRADKPFVTTNIAAIPATLLESELFGREKGAYTGAMNRQAGRFELADGGTLLLDEIGEMPLETQAKLLRALQSGELERLGSSKTLHVDVRIIAATNRNLSQLIQEGKFREDLFYRLDIFPITLPPLRDRPEDIPLLVWSFVKELSDRMGKAIERIRKKDLESLQGYEWPGNVRELRNLVERSLILTQGTELRLELPRASAGSVPTASRLLRQVEKRHIEHVLKASKGRIRGEGGAAEILGMKPTTLYSLMKRLKIKHRDK